MSKVSLNEYLAPVPSPDTFYIKIRMKCDRNPMRNILILLWERCQLYWKGVGIACLLFVIVCGTASLAIQEECFRFNYGYVLLCGPVGGLLKYLTRDILPLNTTMKARLFCDEVFQSFNQCRRGLINKLQTGNRTNS